MNYLPELLLSFLKIGLFSIGGGYATIPLIREQVVELHSWLTNLEFTDIITISQMTPGPLAVNTSTFVGLRIAGVPGAVTATFGCIISGFVISLGLYRFFQRHQGSAVISGVLSGLRSASLGLIMSAAGTILLLALFGTDSSPISLRNLNPAAAGIFLLSLILLRAKKIHPVLLMLLSGAAGLILYT